jgi:hypothetical protein
MVMNGQNTKLKPFKVNNPDGHSCRIQVLEEPHFARAGNVFPSLFDCGFDYGSVWYEHNGAELLQKEKSF